MIPLLMLSIVEQLADSCPDGQPVAGSAGKISNMTSDILPAAKHRSSRKPLGFHL